MFPVRCTRYDLRLCHLQISSRNASFVSRGRKFISPEDVKAKKTFGGWLFLMFPVTAFALGTWQIKRKFWKQKLKSKIEKNFSLEPIDLPRDLSILGDMEYAPFRVTGTFLHDKEILLGPRQLISTAGSKQKRFAPPPESGYLVVTPFKLSDRNLTILVNRGWIPSKSKSSETRREGQIDGVVELVGFLRLNESLSSFGVKNDPGSGIWLYRDLKAMCEMTGADPIFLDADKDSSVPGGPIGGQTNVFLRDEHVTYVFTWYTLAASTLYMWFRKYGHHVRFN